MASFSFYERLGFWPLHFLAKGLLSLWGGLKIRGRQNWPLRGGCILECHYISLAGPVMLLDTLPRPLYYMAASDLFEIPYFSQLITALRAFPVKRGGQDRQALSRCRQLLEAGEAVVIYPEGKLGPSGQLGPLQSGVVMLAMKAQVPIYPIWQVGSDKFLPTGAKFIRWAPKEVRFGPPLYLPPLTQGEGRSVRQQLTEANELLREALLTLGGLPSSERPNS